MCKGPLQKKFFRSTIPELGWGIFFMILNNQQGVLLDPLAPEPKNKRQAKRKRWLKTDSCAYIALTRGLHHALTLHSSIIM